MYTELWWNEFHLRQVYIGWWCVYTSYIILHTFSALHYVTGVYLTQASTVMEKGVNRQRFLNGNIAANIYMLSRNLALILLYRYMKNVYNNWKSMFHQTCVMYYDSKDGSQWEHPLLILSICLKIYALFILHQWRYFANYESMFYICGVIFNRVITILHYRI